VSESIVERIPILGAVRQQKKDEALVRYFTDQFDRAKEDRAQVERQWYLNYAMYDGKQNVQYIRNSTSVGNYSLFIPPAPAWRVRLVINKIRSVVRKELAKTTSAHPTFTVIPETTEEQDIVAARAAEQIFMSGYNDKEIQVVLQQAGFWRSITGCGYIKVWWDQTYVDKRSNQQGDICVERVRPFNIIVPDLMEENIEKQPWVIHAWTMPPEEAQARYMMDKKPDSTHNATQDLMEDAILSLAGSRSAERNEVLVLEVWIKSHPDYPKGGLVTIVGKDLVQNIPEYPYNHGEYPFIKLDHVPTGKYYSESVITDLIPLQRELNRTRSQLVENKNLVGRPRYWADKGSIDATKISGEPGQILFKNPGLQPPVPVEMPQMPQYIMQSLDQLQTDIDDASGQHEISRGGTPNSQLTAATAISFLQEQDDTLLSFTVTSQESGIRKLGRLYLALAEQYWTAERTIKVVGTDQSFEALTFMGGQIRGNRDVRVEVGSSLQVSKAAKTALIMDLIKNGVIKPEDGLRRMEFGGVEKLYEDIEVDRRAAQRENLKLAQGMPLSATPETAFAPNTWDNHGIHVEEHNKFRKTQEFEVLDDSIKMAFEAHVQLHSDAIMAETMNQLAMQGGMEQNGEQPGQPGLAAPAGSQ
jgi:hypothetical protein